MGLRLSYHRWLLVWVWILLSGPKLISKLKFKTFFHTRPKLTSELIFLSDSSSPSPKFKLKASSYKIVSVVKNERNIESLAHITKGVFIRFSKTFIFNKDGTILLFAIVNQFSPSFRAFLLWEEINVKEDSMERNKNCSPRENSTVARTLFDLVIMTKRVSARSEISDARRERPPEVTCVYVESDWK